MRGETVVQDTQVETIHSEGTTIAHIVRSSRQMAYYCTGHGILLMPASNRITLNGIRMVYR